MSTRPIIVLLLLLIASCAAPTVNLVNQYNSIDTAWARTGGTSSISGEAFLRSLEGRIQTCAGLEILLIPESRYAAERFNSVYFHNFGSSIEPITFSVGGENELFAKDRSGQDLFKVTKTGEKLYQSQDGADTLFSVLDYNKTYKSIGRALNFSPSPPEFFTDIARKSCDINGHFEFRDLASGTYYIEAPIFWSVSAGVYVACPEGNCVAGSLGTAANGTAIMMKVDLKEDQTLDIQLSSSYP